MENSSVTVSVKLAYWEAYRLVVVLMATAFRKFLYIYGFVVLSMIAVFISLLFRPRPEEDYAAIIQNGKPLFWLVGIPLLCIFVAPLYSARKIVNDRRISAGARYEFSEAGIHSETSVTKTDMLWTAIFRVKELQSAFLVFTSPKTAYALPKRCFEESQGVTALRELFQTHVENVKLRSERN